MSPEWKLAEHLAEALLAGARRCATARTAEREELERRRDEATSRVEASERLEELRTQARDLEKKTEEARLQLVEIEEEHGAAMTEESRLRETLEVACSTQRELCEQRISAIPLIDPEGLVAWARWLEEWHVKNQRSFAPVRDWPQYFGKREVLGDALESIGLVVRAVRYLEVEEVEGGKTRNEIPKEVEATKAEIEQIQGEIQERLAEDADRFGQVARDLPDPTGVASIPTLELYDSLLTYIEGVLGRFAAAAEVEEVMLEALR